LSSGEAERAAQLGFHADRKALFVSYLTDSGLHELTDLLESGEYSLAVPEEAGLPIVALLAKRGDRARALALLDEMEPFADQLRFAPGRIAGGRLDVANVYRESVGTAAETLRTRKPSRQIETMNEALGVWNPFGDELLSF
jgi:hypothetical protein